MFSKISGFIRPLLFKGDIVNHPDPAGQDREQRGKKDRAEKAEAPEDDTALFSIEAIRAMLRQESGSIEADELLLHLDMLQRHGIASIPVRPEQSVLEAVVIAVRLVRGK